MRSNDCQSFRIEIGHVHRIANGAFEQRGTNRVRDLDPNALLCFRSGRAEMRSKNKIGRAAQWRIGWKRFNFENVQRRAGDMPILQCFHERVFVDQAAPRAIDDADAAFGFLQSRSIENVPRFCGERRVQRDEIRACEQIIELRPPARLADCERAMRKDTDRRQPRAFRKQWRAG